MTPTLLVWLVLFFVLLMLTFARPVFGVSLYMLTYFLCPAFWWWGDLIKTYRWNLYSGIALLCAVILSGGLEIRFLDKWSRRVFVSAALMGVNATFVHFFLADNLRVSSIAYVLLEKFVLLFFMIVLAIRSKSDLKIALLSLVLGATYIGYEVTINDRGEIVDNRLEGVGAPSAAQANEFASLMVTVLPLCGAFFLAGTNWERLLMLPAAPFIVNTLLLCNSRGGNLAAIASAVIFLVVAPKRIRKHAIKIVALGAVVTWLLLGDPRIIERFMTSFVSEEERDHSAESRLQFAKAGIEMIKDYPLGAGGYGFKRVHGTKYLKALEIDDEAHAIHNGFLNEACEWGLQGLTLRLFFVVPSFFLLYRYSRKIAQDDLFLSLMGSSIIAGMSAFIVTCCFGDRLDNEWGYWMVALSVGYAQVVGECVLNLRAPPNPDLANEPVAAPTSA